MSTVMIYANRGNGIIVVLRMTQLFIAEIWSILGLCNGKFARYYVLSVLLFIHSKIVINAIW